MNKIPKKYEAEWKETYQKIQEVISYLSQSFSSKVLEKSDIGQDLWVLFLEMTNRDKKYYRRKPGWYFLRFKWFLLTKYQKEVTRIKREWEYKLRNNPNKGKIQSRIGYLNDKKDDERI